MPGALQVQWRYGSLRGGTNAVFDAEFGGYVSFFHSRWVGSHG